MKLNEIKRIVAARSNGLCLKDTYGGMDQLLIGFDDETAVWVRSEKPEDATFIAVMFNNIDKLLAVAEAAKEAIGASYEQPGLKAWVRKDVATEKLIHALEQLESE